MIESPQLVRIATERGRKVRKALKLGICGEHGGDPASVADEDLIHITWRAGFSAYPTWDSWFAAAGGAKQPRRDLGHTSDTSSIAVDLARSGCGVVLGQYMLAAPELRSGELVAPFLTAMPLQYHYCAVHTPANAGNPTVLTFVKWLAALGAGA